MLLALVLLPALGLMAWNAVEQRRVQEQDVFDESARLARLAAADQEQFVVGARQLLTGLARLPEVRGRTDPDCSATLALVRDAYDLYANVGVAEMDGDVTCTAEPFNGTVNALGRSWFQRTVASGNFSVGDYQIGRITGRATVNFGYPVRDGGGAMVGVLFAALDLVRVSERAAQADLPAGSTVLILDANGTVLARHPDPEEWVGQDLSEEPLAQAILGSPEGRLRSPGLDGTDRFWGFTSIDVAPSAPTVHVAVGLPVRAAFAEIDGVFWSGLALLALVGLVAFALAWVVSESAIVRPSRALVRTTDRISGGDFAARSGVEHGAGEFGQMAASVDRMAASLQRLLAKERLLDQLQQKEAELEARVRQIGELNRELSATNDNLRQLAEELERRQGQLERRNRELDEFAHVVSHDLKAPLRAVTHFSQWVLDDADSKLSEDSRENMRLMRDALQRMERMIDGLLEFARVGLAKGEREDVDSGALVREVVTALAPPPGFRVDVQEGMPTVEAERLRLQQVFQNLIANGLEHHDLDQGAVRVAWQDRGPLVEFTVEDDGPGIPDELKDRLFRMFQPIPSRGKKKRGTGVGLALVKKIVESNGGTIHVENAAPRGTRFRFTWAKRQPGAVA